MRVALLFLLACACGDAAADRVEPFTVWAFDDARALAGVDVAFDPPGGGDRVVRKTADDGSVRFEAVFARGGATVTVASPDHVLFTVLEVGPGTAPPNTRGKPPTDLVVTPPRLARFVRASSIELRGAIAGKDPRGTTLGIAAAGEAGLGSFESTANAYVLRVPRGRPFFLLGHETFSVTNEPTTIVNEHVKSFRVEVPARDADGALDLDLAALPALPTRSVRVRAEMPGGPFVAGTSGSATAVSEDSDVLVAPIDRAAPSVDGRAIDCAMTVADTDIAPERAVTRVVLVAPDGSRSTRTEAGIVADGATIRDFLRPVAVPDGVRSQRNPIALDGFPEGAALSIEVISNGEIGWILESSKKLASVTLPVPPGPLPPALVAVRILARTERAMSTSRDLLLAR